MVRAWGVVAHSPLLLQLVLGVAVVLFLQIFLNLINILKQYHTCK